MSKATRSKFTSFDVYLNNGKGLRISAEDFILRDGTPPVVLFRSKSGTSYTMWAAVPVNVINALGVSGYVSPWTPPQ